MVRLLTSLGRRCIGNSHGRRLEGSCARFILVEVCPHEKSSSGSGGSFGVLCCTTGSCRNRFWNPAAFPIPCLDFFKPLRPRIPRQLQSAESGCYYRNSKVTGKHPAAVAESCGPRCPGETALGCSSPMPHDSPGSAATVDAHSPRMP